jgi:microcystin synthetase protein McyA
VSGDVSPTQQRSHAFEINALVLDGQLTVEWAYSTEEYQPQTVERLAASFDAQLRALIAACASTDRSPIAAGALPSTEIDPQALAVLLGQLRS